MPNISKRGASKSIREDQCSPNLLFIIITTTTFLSIIALPYSSITFSSKPPKPLTSAKMVSFTTIAIVSFATFSLIEPSLGAGAAARVGVSVVSSTLGGNNHKRDVSTESAAEKQLESNFATCLSNLHAKIPTMTYNADRSVDMGNLPASCMHEVEAYNNQTNIKEMDATHGRIIIKGHDSIHMDQIPADLHKLLEEKLGKPGSNKPHSA